MPTGNSTDILKLLGGDRFRVSLVDVSNPGVFILAHDLGLGDQPRTPAEMEADVKLKIRLDHRRRADATAMGFDPDVESIPKGVVSFPFGNASDVSIRCLAMFMGQAHIAVSLNLAFCLGAATRLQGTVASELVDIRSVDGETIAIGHPSGKLDIGIILQDVSVLCADLLRTARLLMKGDVYSVLLNKVIISLISRYAFFGYTPFWEPCITIALGCQLPLETDRNVFVAPQTSQILKQGFGFGTREISSGRKPRVPQPGTVKTADPSSGLHNHEARRTN